MERIRAIQKRFMSEELRNKQDLIRVSDYVARVALLGGSALTLLVGGFLALTTRRQLREVADQYETVLRAEEQVRERLATTLTSIGEGVIVTDPVGRVTLVNPVTESLTGWGNDEARGKDHRKVFDIAGEGAMSGEMPTSPIDRVIQENRTVPFGTHTVLRRGDGRRIAVEDSASPVRDKEGNVTGVVLVFRDVTERKERETALATALEKNRRIAETLQQSMLTAPPRGAFPGLSVATLYEPASNEAEVGGDFFDAISLRGDYVALVVGDATGKGLDAAATTGALKFALRAYLYDDPDPAQAITRLNRFLCDPRNSHPSHTMFSFLSVAIAVVNAKTGEGLCAVAGADPPLLIRAGGDTQEAARPGVMIGASAESQYTGDPLLLAHGDMIAFTTDGITEARRGRREFFGYEGFARVLSEMAAGETIPLDALTARVASEARNHAGGQLKDDVCLLIARREGE